MNESHLVHQDATNVVLVDCLTRLSWTPEQFAYHLNRLARSLRPAVPEIHPKTPWRWLTARPPATKPCIPRQPWPGLVCSLRAPRGALMYRPRSGHGLEEVFVGLMAYPDP